MNRQDPMRERAQHEAAQRRASQQHPPKVSAAGARPSRSAEQPETPPPAAGHRGPIPKPLVR